MNKNLTSDQIKSAFNVCATICAQDGIISSQEESCLTSHFSDLLGLRNQDFDVLFDDFFESESTFDDFLEAITDKELRKSIIFIAQESASADGLDIKENIALNRARLVWGLT